MSSTQREPTRAACGVGIGLRQPHYEAVLDGRPPLAFVEVHSENFFADGGAALAVLHEARAQYDVSLHGVGLALGSAAGLDPWHLDRLERLVRRIEPVRVSDHASFARVARPDGAVVHGADLLPIAFADAALAILVDGVQQVQERLRRPILVENVSAYLSYADDAIDEPEFFARLCRQSGCGLLLDVNNLMVNALNGGADGALERCRGFVDRIPREIVGEIHLAGYDDRGALVIDDHGSRVRADVWTLYEHALRRFGAQPTLIEWDTDLPALDVLLAEADVAARIAARSGAAPGVAVAA
ncbi:MAG: DUF692 domain-containing protein [Caldimonas sp.]